MKATALVLPLALISLLPVTPARACTSFLLTRGGERVFGKSYDWNSGHGLLLVNKRGVAKRALLLPGTPASPASWVSRFGNVTFNQYGRDLPLGGMNEKGLVVEVMWLSKTDHGAARTKKPALNELQWIQYVLDTSATTAEAITRARKVHVIKAHGAVHYLACDRDGRCATFEYLGGKLVIHSGKKLPVSVLANDTYADSVTYLRRHAGFGGTRSTPTTLSSADRFVRAAALVRQARSKKGKGAAVVSAARVLDSVHTRGWTKWQIVYEPRAGRVHFRAAPGRKFHVLDARAQDYSCETPVKVVDLLGTITGKRLGPAVDYQYAHNLKMLQVNLKKLSGRLPPALLKLAAAYPELATRCMLKKKPTNK